MLWVQWRHNCSPAASFVNGIVTLHLFKVYLQTFLSIQITQKCQILSCDTLVANEQYDTAVYLFILEDTEFILYNCDVLRSHIHFVLGRKTLSCTVRHSTWHLNLKLPSINNTRKHRACWISCTSYMSVFYCLHTGKHFCRLWCLLWSLSPTWAQSSLCRWYHGANFEMFNPSNKILKSVFSWTVLLSTLTPFCFHSPVQEA